MMNYEFIQKVAILDVVAEKAGGYVINPHPDNNKIGYDYPAITEYCRDRNIKPAMLADFELAQFRTR